MIVGVVATLNGTNEKPPIIPNNEQINTIIPKDYQQINKILGQLKNNNPDDGGAGGGGSPYETNIKVDGIEEADIIESDGECFCFSLGNQSNVIIMKAYPANSIDIVATIELEKNNIVHDMYLEKNMLIIISENAETLKSTKSKVFVYDLSNISNPKLKN